MELQGLTPVDTLYEYAGHVMALRISEYLLYGGYLLWFVVASALLRLYYQGTREGSFVPLGVYPVYVLVMFLVVAPVRVSVLGPPLPGGSPGAGLRRDVQVPRVLAYTGAIVDRLQVNLAGDLGDLTGSAAREWEQAAAMVERLRIQSPALRAELGAYARACYWPALAGGEPPGGGEPWDLVPFAGLGIDPWLAAVFQDQELEARLPGGGFVPCSELSLRIDRGLSAEIAAPPHRAALEQFRRTAETSRSGGSDPAAFYRRRLVYNEIFGGGGGELAAVREALPAFSPLGPGGLSLAHLPVTTDGDGSFTGLVRNVAGNLPGVAAGLASAVSEWWSQRAMGPAAYYRVSALGPYVYGMVIAVLLLLFPVAGLHAFWPGGHMALVNYLKVFLSVKCWPILWSFLSGMLASRHVFTGATPGGFEGGIGGPGPLPAIAILYVLVPGLSFMALNFAQQAGAGLFSGLLGGSQGASPGFGLALGSLAYRGGVAAGEAALGALRGRPRGGAA